MLMTHLRRILLPTLVLLAFVPVLLGAEPAADLDVRPAAGGSFPARFVVYEGALYFTAFAPLVGTELWRTDGTAAGTELFLDLFPGRDSSGPRGLVVFRGRLYFLAGDPSGWALFATDGTRQGTERIVDVPSRSGIPQSLVATAEALYFVGWTAEHGAELFTSDGTRAGTRLLAGDLSAQRRNPPQRLTPIGDELFFVADDGVHGSELWTSDGSAAGTVLVEDIFPGPGSGLSLFGVEGLPVHDGALSFGADSGDGLRELWTSDGTAAGTRLVHRFEGVPSPCLPSGPSELAATADGALVFAGSTAVDGGELSSRGDCELWVSAAGGTRLLADLEPGSASSGLRSFTAAGGKVFFTARTTAHGLETWVTDGTAAGTRLVKDVDPRDSPTGSRSLAALGDRIVFSATHPDTGEEPWTSDGTQEGTFLLRDVRPGPQPSSLHLEAHSVLGGRLFFGADDRVVGDELWATDATAAGTGLVADLNGVGSSSDPTGFVALGERLLVQTRPQGKLWSVEGGGAEVVAEDSDELFRAGDAVFFQRRFDGELWSTDGTAAGSTALAPFGCLAGMASYQDRLFFLALDGSDDQSAGLWTSDGTAAGTFQVAPLPRPGDPGFGIPGQFCPQPRAAAAVGGGELFFAAQNYLLRTDGTAEGSRIVDAEGCPPVSLANGEEVVAVGDVLFYSSAPPGARRVLVRLGTAEACPVALRELDSLPDTESFLEGAFPPRRPRLDSLTPVGDRLFFVAETEDLGVELWTSDGTAGGTRPVRDLRPGSAGSEPRDLLALGGRLLFTAGDGTHGRELWASDGTAAGTVLVVDLLAGPDSSAPQGLVQVDGLALFAAADGEHGLELWRSDGTAEGTWLVDDVQPGPLSSSPSSLTALGDRLYMNAGIVESGFEVFSVAREAILEGPDDEEEPDDPCPSCLRGGRFTVEVRFKNQHDGGSEGPGQPLRFSDETVLFWFFKESNVELILKVLDGRRINGHFWVFYGGLSDVEYWITVTDTFDGAERVYHNPPGGICGQGDTRAF